MNLKMSLLLSLQMVTISKEPMNCDLAFKFDYNAGTIELYSSYSEWIGNAYSISSLIELLTKLRNDELA